MHHSNLCTITSVSLQTKPNISCLLIPCSYFSSAWLCSRAVSFASGLYQYISVYFSLFTQLQSSSNISCHVSSLGLCFLSVYHISNYVVLAIKWGVACFHVKYLLHVSKPGFPQIQEVKKKEEKKNASCFCHGYKNVTVTSEPVKHVSVNRSVYYVSRSSRTWWPLDDLLEESPVQISLTSWLPIVDACSILYRKRFIWKYLTRYFCCQTEELHLKWRFLWIHTCLSYYPCNDHTLISSNWP